jgi:hypothetical protein
MGVRETLGSIRYVTDANGEKTDVLVPLSTWEALLAAWQRLIERIEDQEDRAILQEWVAKRAAGEAKTVSLEDLEQELRADGLLSHRSR